MLEISLLGSFRASYAGRAVTALDSPRLQALLAYLLLNSAHPQSRLRLAGRLWPDAPEPRGLNNLRALVLRLRFALPQPDDFLKVERSAIQWRSEAPFRLDVREFSGLLEQAGAAPSPAEALEKLRQAVALYRGDLLPDCPDEWILPERERLSQLFGAALEKLVRALEEAQDYPAAIEHARQLLRYDPLNEQTYVTLMRLLAAAGDRAGALRCFHLCASTLKREMGLEPGPETLEIYRQLLGRPGGRVRLAKAAPGPRQVSVPLVGRERELAKLQEYWQSAASGRMTWVAVAGKAGLGKTRLAEELLNWAARHGFASAGTRCYASECGRSYAPLAGWLKAPEVRRALPSLNKTWQLEIARLLPEILKEAPDLEPPGPLTGSWQVNRLYEGLARGLLANPRLRLLLLDNLHWCDAATVAFLRYLAGFDPARPLLLVCTYRPGELKPHSPQAALLDELKRAARLAEIKLKPLSEEETLNLGRAVGGPALKPDSLSGLYLDTAGSPLFIVETVLARQAEAERAELAAPEGPALNAGKVPGLPAPVKAVINQRLAQLSPPATALLELAATLGRSFTLPVLASASWSNQDQFVSGLDELWQRRIIREQGQESYDFSHARIQEAAYAGLNPARRSWLHRRVAGALKTVYAANLDPVRASLACHYEAAGDLEQAIEEYRQAALIARRIFAGSEALAYLERALKVLQAAPLPAEKRAGLAAGLNESRGDLLQLAGSYREAVQAYREALEQTPAPATAERERLARQITACQPPATEPDERLNPPAPPETACGPDSKI